MPIRPSKLGLSLAGIYAFLTAAAIIAAVGVGDSKGQFVFLQLPLVLQMALLVAVLPEALTARLVDVSWPTAYLLIWPPTALVFYAAGSGIDALVRRRRTGKAGRLPSR